jgi:hypothetical protein
MKKDLTITTAIAAAFMLTACGPNPNSMMTDRDTAICTDRQGRRVSDDKCQRRGVGGGGYAWYFMGRNSTMPWVGERATGGSYRGAQGVSYFRASPSTSVTRAVGISRGGFSSGYSSGGFGS